MSQQPPIQRGVDGSSTGLRRSSRNKRSAPAALVEPTLSTNHDASVCSDATRKKRHRGEAAASISSACPSAAAGSTAASPPSIPPASVPTGDEPNLAPLAASVAPRGPSFRELAAALKAGAETLLASCHEINAIIDEIDLRMDGLNASVVKLHRCNFAW